jgi:DNA uptake protein ComE-like DNA-binding protein
MSIDQPPPATPEAARAGRREGGRAGRHGSAPASFAWAFAPLYTIGIGTWAVFLYAAIRRRSWSLGGAAGLYAVLLAVFVVAETPSRPAPAASAIGALAWLVCAVGGAAHALAVRRRVFFPFVDPAGQALERAAAQVLERRKLRERARAVVAKDPKLARELGIGRPDLRRDYDDGGLVDVNHAPAAALETLPGMTAGLAAKAVALRAERGAYVSADDLCTALDMSPDTVSDLADRTIYLS